MAEELFEASDAPPGCLSLLALDALATDGRAPEAGEAAHLSACERCRLMLAEMRSANRFLERFQSGGGEAPSDMVRGAEHLRAPGYRVSELIAFGGQGAVYRAVQTATGREVAIKVPIGDLQRRPSARYRFQREIELTARLNHPGIVRVLGACELDDGRVGCVMEFVEGVAFDRWARPLREQGAGSVRPIVEGAAHVADAIAYAHQRAVMHRDLKPSNVVVTDDGAPRVLDFGLAKVLGESAPSFATMTGAFVGTLLYAAPEQVAEGAEATDLRTDVYALGLLLFQALTGRLPHSADAPTEEVLRQIREGAVARPSSMAAGVGAELDAIVLKAMAKEKDRRYATAGELRDDLRAWLDGRAVRARFDSRWYVIGKVLARRRRLVGVVSVLAVAVLGGGTISIANMARAAEAQRREAYESQRAASEVARADAVQQIIDELVPVTGGGDAAAVARRNLDLLDAKLEAGLLRGRPLVESSVRALLGSIYADRGEWGLAEYNYRQALGLARRERGADHPATAHLADALASALTERGKLVEARALAGEALALRQASLGPSHPDVGASLVTLGRIALRDRSLERAGALATQADAILAGSPLATAQQTMACLVLRSEVEAARGRSDDAAALATDALRIALRHDSDEHPRVIRALRNAATHATAAGREDGARDAALADALAASRTDDRTAAVWRSLIELKRRVLGDDAPELAPSYSSLGRRLEREGDHAGAVAAHSEAMRVLTLAEGAESLAVADCSYYLQYPLGSLGRVGEWCDLLERRYRVYRREFLGVQNIAIVVAHREWATVLGAMALDDEAEAELAATMLEIGELCHGDPLEMLRARTSLAEVLAARNNPARQDLERAEAIALEIREPGSGAPAVEVRRAALVLAAALAERDDLDGVPPLVEEFAGLVPEPKAWHSNLTGTSARMMLRISAAYDRAGRPEPERVTTLRRWFGVEPERAR